MIDVQIIAGRRPELLMESLGRVLLAGSLINHVYVANNTGISFNINHDKVTVIENERSYTFEENNNNLAKMGTSEYILFLDDDAFIFPGAVELMFDAIVNDQNLLLVGGVNNQTWQPSEEVVVPKVATLEYFISNIEVLSNISFKEMQNYGSHADVRLFCPGNLMLTRRTIWQHQYGGWDEAYRNWNEEIDYVLWGYERGMKTVVLPGVWFFHGMSSSRQRSQLLDNIVKSSCHLLHKFPQERISKIREFLLLINGCLINQLDGLFEFNNNCKNDDFVASCNYYTKIMPHLSDLTCESSGFEAI